MGGVTVCIWDAFTFRPFSVPKIAGLDCVGLVWDAKESFADWCIDQPMYPLLVVGGGVRLGLGVPQKFSSWGRDLQHPC